jgi:hypothetical protein
MAIGRRNNTIPSNFSATQHQIQKRSALQNGLLEDRASSLAPY